MIGTTYLLGLLKGASLASAKLIVLELIMQVERLDSRQLLTLLVGADQAKVLIKRGLTEAFGFSKPRQSALSEPAASYSIPVQLRAAKELVKRAMLEDMESGSVDLSDPLKVATFLCSEIGHLDHEVFYVLYLDSQYRLIHAEPLSKGTLNQASVYPREVVKRALKVGAAACILAHNHPSGKLEASRPDIELTRHLRKALDLVDVKVVDHLIVSGSSHYSMATYGDI